MFQKEVGQHAEHSMGVMVESRRRMVWSGLKYQQGGLEGWTDLGYVFLGTVLFNALKEMHERQGDER